MFLSDQSTTVEAFFEGADNVFEGALDNFSSKKIIIRETAAAKHKYTNKEVATCYRQCCKWYYKSGNRFCHLQMMLEMLIDSLEQLGFEDTNNASSMTITSDWVDEKNPPLTVAYDEINQRLQFQVDRTILERVLSQILILLKFTVRKMLTYQII